MRIRHDPGLYAPSDASAEPMNRRAARARAAKMRADVARMENLPPLPGERVCREDSHAMTVLLRECVARRVLIVAGECADAKPDDSDLAARAASALAEFESASDGVDKLLQNL